MRSQAVIWECFSILKGSATEKTMNWNINCTTDTCMGNLRFHESVAPCELLYNLYLDLFPCAIASQKYETKDRCHKTHHFGKTTQELKVSRTKMQSFQWHASRKQYYFPLLRMNTSEARQNIFVTAISLACYHEAAVNCR